MKEPRTSKTSSPTSSGAKSLEKDQEPLKQDKLHNESQEQDLKAKRSRKKYSFGRGKCGKRQTVSINTEAPVQGAINHFIINVDGFLLRMRYRFLIFKSFWCRFSRCI